VRAPIGAAGEVKGGGVAPYGSVVVMPRECRVPRVGTSGSALIPTLNRSLRGAPDAYYP
jgi:hypothetical protein